MHIVANGFDDKEHALAEQLSCEIETAELADEAYFKFDKSGLYYYPSMPGTGARHRNLHVDFLEPTLQRRINWKQLKSEQILKACNLIKEKNQSVLDLTAGFGVDALLCAAAGATVTMLERSPIIATLLQDALHRMNHYNHGLKLELKHIDSKDYLKNISENYDVIYIDPMHPERRSAAVSQSLEMLRDIVGEDQDFVDLFEIARTKVNKRLVVKWPSKAESPLPKADFSYPGKAIRYDCYHSKSA